MADNDAGTEWVYRYDEQGHRIGLMQVPIKSTDSGGSNYNSHWFGDIEPHVILRERFAKFTTTISTFELKVLKLSQDALTYTLPNGFQPSVRRSIIYHFYYTDGGQRVTVPVPINLANDQWIWNYIRQRLLLLAMPTSNRDIEFTLDSVSAAYEVAELFNKPVIVRISESLQHRLGDVAA